MAEPAIENQIEKLNAIGIALNSEHNLNKLLELILAEARDLTEADAGTLYIRENDQLHFEVSQNETLMQRLGYVPYKKKIIPVTKDSIAGYVALTGKILNIDDAYDLKLDSEFNISKSFDQKWDYRTKSMLIVPMLDEKEKNIGVIQLINSTDASGKVVSFLASHENLAFSLASQAAVAIRNTRLIQQIKDLFKALVQYSATAIDQRSPHTAGHSRRVAEYSMRFAYCLNEQNSGPFKDIHFSEEELEELNIAAWLHDIGKLGVREIVLDKAFRISSERMENIKWRFKAAIWEQEKKFFLSNLKEDPEEKVKIEKVKEQLNQDLKFLEEINPKNFVKDEEIIRVQEISTRNITDAKGNSIFLLDLEELKNFCIKAGNLNDLEWLEIRSHPVNTYNILEKMPFPEDLQRVPEIARAHHELINGNGYPDKLTGEKIPIQVRIITVSDIFDALTAHDRPYKPALPLEKALNILKEEANINRIDQNLVDLFIEKQLYLET